jgi:hypothetical protein
VPNEGVEVRTPQSVVVSLPAGAIIGLAFGYATRSPFPRGNVSFFSWISYVPGESVFWIASGAFVAAGAILHLAPVTN